MIGKCGYLGGPPLKSLKPKKANWHQRYRILNSECNSVTPLQPDGAKRYSGFLLFWYVTENENKTNFTICNEGVNNKL